MPERGAGEGSPVGLPPFRSVARRSGRRFGGLMTDTIGSRDGPCRKPKAHHRILLRLVSASTVMALVWACGGEGPAAPTTPEPTRPTTVTDADRAALVALYEATDGPNWINSENWLTDAPLGEWYGVDTDAAGRVIRMDLAGRRNPEGGFYVQHGLSGPIPPEIGDLTGLEWLYLSDNDLSGPIPPEVGSVVSLERLYLHRNELTGPIPPELGNLTNLTDLNLSSNHLSGPIATEIGELGSLTSLSLAANRLTGPVPSELGNLGHLQSLYLQYNELSGPIPSELGMLVNLDRLRLEWNNLTGSIPDSFLDLDALERFRFERNAQLCAPGTGGFVTWLEDIEDTSGPYCNESDMKVLDRLYQTSGGPDWTTSSGWLETPALEEWYGVTANALGRGRGAGSDPERLGG